MYGDPLRCRIQARLAFAAVRVLDEPLSVPHQASDIHFIVENPRSAGGIAVDRAGTPHHAPGTANPLMVETLTNRKR